MALVRVPGSGLWIPAPYINSLFGLATPLTALTASTHKYSFTGNIIFPDHAASKNIQTIQFRFGAITKAGGSTLKVSVQNPSLVIAASPIAPSGTVLQSFTIANADANFATNTNYTGTLGAVQSVNYGAQICVVIEYATFAGADSVTIMQPNSAVTYKNSGTSVFTAAWALAATNSLPGIIFGFDDGSFGYFDTAQPIGLANSNTVSVAYNSGSSPNEIALPFQFPFPCVIDGVWFSLTNAALTSAFNINIYNGTTLQTSVAYDAHLDEVTGSMRPVVIPISEVSIAANTQYFMGIAPTTANNVTAFFADLASQAMYNPAPDGTSMSYATRTGAGAWTITNTRRFIGGVRISQLDNGAGGGFGQPLIGRLR